MLTKIALLLAHHADEHEWLFEMQSMDDQSRRGHARGHAFLFVYTVARYCVAADRLHAGAGTTGDQEAAPFPEADPFFNDFAQAVASNDSQQAFELWISSPLSAATEIAAPSIRQIARSYLRRMAVPEAEFVATKIADFLPAPFVSATGSIDSQFSDNSDS